MTASTILVADDDDAVRTVIAQALTRAGYEVRTASNAATLWQWVEKGEGDLVITDVVMPDENGLDLVPRIRHIRPDLRIVVMSAQTTLMTAVKATERGAFEYLPKPFDINELVSVVKRGLKAGVDISARLDEDGVDETLPLIGRSPAMQDVYRTVARLMPTDLTVMINGESGTGKELVARALHDYGKRKNAPFIAVNMAAIPRELIESELFGHEKGAFTGAMARSSGRFEQAEGGTLFLDEIGDMPLEAQTRLLRVLQEGEFTAVGGRTSMRTDVRIIAATHHDLKKLIRQGLFREDLFFRLNVVPLRLPPLRERTEDIPELVRHFLSRAASAGLPWKTIAKEALDLLKRHDWPGNVRELENMVQRLAALCPQELIGADEISRELDDSDGQSGASEQTVQDGLGKSVEKQLAHIFAAHSDALPAAGLYDWVLKEIEKPLITLTLQATRGNQLKAAQVLGLNRNTLRKKIRDLAIPVIRAGR
ncbi:MAG: nitrogen regulation protein NR(I) [Rhodospirillaceae bacterium]|jgi:two-component system nitrogen regulation response regulator GlnG|nr:nitrogen regulation protein NR(I) [Rhodospirillaceae bacterium]MBT5513889.1 nitrogen regulation protein NR(I) [Rhodospirillaceae bacterium]MBT6085927.1 nitrogen regulation protein NR(I) [Rhodospirillaceae bacterium]MBT6609107.1 nitrogen regulation protein NR(I) [Rhodospirillaceae bacterium]MBT6884071.1 nitrogen regulation protein NR(I) [Rhodospirillaceae bacterium]